MGGTIFGSILPVLAALILSLVTIIVIGFLLKESKPVCIEAASERREGKEFVPAHALKKYTFNQLAAHLEIEIHNQREFVDVALRASIYLYSQAFADAFEEIEHARQKPPALFLSF